MRAVIQRVCSAYVECEENETTREVARIERGILILVGVKADDNEGDARWLAEKVATLRIFEDEAGKLNLALGDIAGSALVVSNFTLYGDCRKGRRPSFSEAASGPEARALYERFAEMLRASGIPVETGVFGAQMRVTLQNDGPITLVIDTPRAQAG